MKITNKHRASLFDIPLFIGDNNSVATYSEGVRRLRKHLDLNTKKFGAKVSVSKSTVDSWEQQLRQPSILAMMRMHKLYKRETF